MLLQAGASSSVQDVESGYSALHRAFLCCKSNSAAALVRSGASVHAPRDHEGHTPLELLHRRWGRRSAAPAAAGPTPSSNTATVLAPSTKAPPADDETAPSAGAGELYTWGDAACAGLGRPWPAANRARHAQAASRLLSASLPSPRLSTTPSARRHRSCALAVDWCVGWASRTR